MERLPTIPSQGGRPSSLPPLGFRLPPRPLAGPPASTQRPSHITRVVSDQRNGSTSSSGMEGPGNAGGNGARQRAAGPLLDSVEPPASTGPSSSPLFNAIVNRLEEILPFKIVVDEKLTNPEYWRTLALSTIEFVAAILAWRGLWDYSEDIWPGTKPEDDLIIGLLGLLTLVSVGSLSTSAGQKLNIPDPKSGEETSAERALGLLSVPPEVEGYSDSGQMLALGSIDSDLEDPIATNRRSRLPADRERSPPNSRSKSPSVREEGGGGGRSMLRGMGSVSTQPMSVFNDLKQASEGEALKSRAEVSDREILVPLAALWKPWRAYQDIDSLPQEYRPSFEDDVAIETVDDPSAPQSSPGNREVEARFVHDRIPVMEARIRARGFFQLLSLRRSVRQYSSDHVPLEVLEDCIRAAGTAPSAQHMQPWKFVVVVDRGLKTKIRKIIQADKNAVASGSADPRQVYRMLKGDGVESDWERRLLEEDQAGRGAGTAAAAEAAASSVSVSGSSLDEIPGTWPNLISGGDGKGAPGAAAPVEGGPAAAAADPDAARSNGNGNGNGSAASDPAPSGPFSSIPSGPSSPLPSGPFSALNSTATGPFVHVENVAQGVAGLFGFGRRPPGAAGGGAGGAGPPPPPGRTGAPAKTDGGMENAPYLVVLMEQRYRDVGGRMVEIPRSVESCGMASGFFVAALHNANLTTATIYPTQGARDAIRETLGRTAAENVFMVLPVGYPSGGTSVPYRRGTALRKSLAQIMKIV